MSEVVNKKQSIQPELLRHLNRRHKAIVVDCEAVEINACDMMWSGGTRYQYHMIEIESGWTVPVNLSGLASSPFSGGKLSTDVEVPTGFVLIKSGTFCGKTAAETLFGRKRDILK